MARRDGTTRLGMVGLLMLVVTLCLAVLGVLAVVTAHGDAVLSERQSEAVGCGQAADAAAQGFLAEVDSFLARTAAEKGPSVRASVLSAELIEELPKMVDALLRSSGGAAEMFAEPSPLVVDAAALSAEELRGYLGEEARGDTASYPCGIRAVFTVEGARTLDLVIALRSDLTYEPIDRSLTTEWTEGPSAPRFWEG